MSKVFFVVDNAHHKTNDKNHERNNGNYSAQKSVAVHKSCGNTENNKTKTNKSAAESFGFAPFFILFNGLFVFKFRFYFIRNKFLISCVFSSSDKNNSENNAENKIYVIN